MSDVKFDPSIILMSLKRIPRQFREVVTPFPEIEGLTFVHVPQCPGYAMSSDGTLWSCLKTSVSTGIGILDGKWKPIHPRYRDLLRPARKKPEEVNKGVIGRPKGSKERKERDYRLGYVFYRGNSFWRNWSDIWKDCFGDAPHPDGIIPEYEYVQSGNRGKLSGEMRRAVSRLEKGFTLTDEEMALAKRYLAKRAENNGVDSEGD